MFEITKCFRNGDAKGRFHNPEFTMLEWYTVDADYMDSIPLTEELCHRLAADFAPERQELQESFLKYSMQELFRETLGVDLESMDTSGALQQQCEKSGLMYTSEDSWETLFNRIFLTQVEPHIPSHRPCILYDYPARIPCLAKPIPGTPWCERWELYYQEMEIANCFSEETDPERVRAYLEHEIARLPGSLREWVDTAFVSLFTPDFPRCSGVALGMDRLIMALTGASTISEVLLFPF
jgi:lysyl-tRNA synthetase class 2